MKQLRKDSWTAAFKEIVNVLRFVLLERLTMRNPMITTSLLATFCISLLFVTGCDPSSLNNRNLRGQGARSLVNLNNNQGILSTNAHYVAYLVYNTTSSSPGVGLSGQSGGVVSGVGEGNNGNVVSSAGEGNVVSSMGGQNGGAPCMVRAIAVNESRDGFLWNANIGRTLQNVRCSPDSQITATGNGFLISAGSQLNHSTYLPMTTYGAVAQPVQIPTGPITKIDGDSSGYIVAQYAQGTGKEHVVLVMYELGRYQNRPVPSRVDEIEFHNRQVRDVVIDHHTGMMTVATTSGGIGQILQFDLEQSGNYENVQTAMNRLSSNAPFGTNVNSGMIYGYQTPGYNENVYYTASAPRAVSNFDGLTAVLDQHGAFVIEELYGQDVNNLFTDPQGNPITVPDGFIGARAEYLNASNYHTANPNVQPQAYNNYQDIAVGNNVFYLINQSGRLFTFYGDTRYSSNGNNGINLNMTADTINLDNDAGVMAVSGPNSIRILSTEAYGANPILIQQGNNGSENIFRESSGRIIDNAIFVNRVQIGMDSLSTEQVPGASNEENNQENNEE